MRVSLGDQIRLQVNVEQRAGLDSVKSVVTVIVLTNAGDIEFQWTREFGSDCEIEFVDLINRVKSILVGGKNLDEAIVDSLTAVQCASDKVERIVAEGEMWSCAKLIASLLIGRHGSPTEAVKKLQQVRETLESAGR